MESKIQVDVSMDGQPQIKIDYRGTDDLRDRMLGRFINWLQILTPGSKRKGFWAYVRLGHEYQSRPGGEYDSLVAFIEPLDKNVLKRHIPEMKAAIEDDYAECDACRSGYIVDDLVLREKSKLPRFIKQPAGVADTERNCLIVDVSLDGQAMVNRVANSIGAVDWEPWMGGINGWAK